MNNINETEIDLLLDEMVAKIKSNIRDPSKYTRNTAFDNMVIIRRSDDDRNRRIVNDNE